MAEQRLLTLLQISDLHVGKLDAKGDAETGVLWSQIYSTFPYFEGMLGHHWLGLEELAAFYMGLLSEDPVLLVSGDVTRCGNSGSFQIADHYLGAFLQKNATSSNVIGLDVRDWRSRAIPGNHDHWAGRSVIVGGPTSAFGTFFSPLPAVVDIPLYGRKIQLRIGMINTDRDVHPWSSERSYAVGVFDTELPPLLSAFGAVGPVPEIRVLMMHHSWEPPITNRILKIADQMRDPLAQLIVDAKINVVLTGHIHAPHVDTFTPLSGAGDVLECRCGTTTVFDYWPNDWVTLLGHKPNRILDANTLLVHRIFLNEDGQLNWDVECHVRTHQDGFKPTPICSNRYPLN